MDALAPETFEYFIANLGMAGAIGLAAMYIHKTFMDYLNKKDQSHRDERVERDKNFTTHLVEMQSNMATIISHNTHAIEKLSETLNKENINNVERLNHIMAAIERRNH